MNKIALLAGLAVAATASAETLLLVDLTVANQVTISSTGGLSSATTSSNDFTGALLANFYGGAGGNGHLYSGGVGDLVYGDGGAGDGTPGLFNSAGNFGLNVWSLGGSGSFTSGVVAFTGSATWAIDPADYADMVAGNASGDIYAPADTDDDIGGATVVGQWALVPAPSSLALLGMGGMVAARRRR